MADDQRTCLHLAASEGNLPVVQTLLRNGAAINCTDRWGGTPLRDAVRSGASKVATFLKGNGAELALSRMETASQLCTLALNGQVEKLAAYVEAGADCNATDWDHRTALHIAACTGHKAAVSTLIGLGADATAKDRFGNTPQDDAERAGVLAQWGPEIWSHRTFLSRLMA